MIVTFYFLIHVLIMTA